MGWIRRHVRYANVMSTLALFVALGGGAYAVTALPANSVGTRELVKGAVTGDKIAARAITANKVKKGSLLKADFKSGQLPAGPQGAQGPRGRRDPRATPALLPPSSLPRSEPAVHRSIARVAA